MRLLDGQEAPLRELAGYDALDPELESQLLTPPG